MPLGLILLFTFTFMHLADAFIQSDLHCILHYSFYILSALAFPGNRTHDLGVASAMLYQLSYRKAQLYIYNCYIIKLYLYERCLECVCFNEDICI